MQLHIACPHGIAAVATSAFRITAGCIVPRHVVHLPARLLEGTPAVQEGRGNHLAAPCDVCWLFITDKPESRLVNPRVPGMAFKILGHTSHDHLLLLCHLPPYDVTATRNSWPASPKKQRCPSYSMEGSRWPVGVCSSTLKHPMLSPCLPYTVYIAVEKQMTDTPVLSLLQQQME